MTVGSRRVVVPRGVQALFDIVHRQNLSLTKRPRGAVSTQGLSHETVPGQ